MKRFVVGEPVRRGELERASVAQEDLPRHG
jgi:hypothetical protein